MSRRASYAPAVEDALRWLNEHSVQSCMGNAPRSFIPTRVAKAYFDRARLLTVLENVFGAGPQTNRTAKRIDTEQYQLVFLILLRIDQPRQIPSFLRFGDLSDEYLPFYRTERFPRAVDFELFDYHQQAFRVRKFQTDKEENFSEDSILPIEKNDLIFEGENATVHRIQIHKDFDDLYPRDENHTYAIKTFRGSRGQRVYKVEHEGHSAVASVGQPIESLVRMYSHFTYQDECSIVFEYVEGPTWREYMEKTEPPKRPNDVAKIWRSLLELAEAVDRFHTAKGCHQDISPMNLLVKRRPNGNEWDIIIKLVDFGRSQFSDSMTEYAEPEYREMYGSPDFGAPESYRGNKYTQTTQMYITQASDIWSLACVWSEAAEWLSGGWDGVLHYENDRRKELEALGIRDIACFHDSTNMLKSVTSQVQYNESKIADDEDDVTAEVIYALVSKMLNPNPQLRPRSRDVQKRTTGILRSFRRYVSIPNTPGSNEESLNMQGLNLERPCTVPMERVVEEDRLEGFHATRSLVAPEHSTIAKYECPLSESEMLIKPTKPSKGSSWATIRNKLKRTSEKNHAVTGRNASHQQLQGPPVARPPQYAGAAHYPSNGDSFVRMQRANTLPLTRQDDRRPPELPLQSNSQFPTANHTIVPHALQAPHPPHWQGHRERAHGNFLRTLELQEVDTAHQVEEETVVEIDTQLLNRRQHASKESVRMVRQFIRDRYRLDLHIWKNRDVQDADRDFVVEDCRRSDRVLERIRAIVSSWDADLFDADEWEVARTIKAIFTDESSIAIWHKLPPWCREQNINT